MSKFSVRKPMTVVVAVIAVILLGAISFLNMSTDLFPSMNLPYVVVMTTYQGASPEEVEQQVTRPIEQALASTGNLQNITSVSSENSSMVILEFVESTNMDSTIIEMNESMRLIESYLPDGAGTPIMMKLNPSMMPIMMIAIDQDGQDLDGVSQLVEDELTPAFERLEGVASVSGSGLLEKSIRVEIEQEKIDEINQKVLQSIDGELAEAQEGLETAQGELDEQRQKAESQIDAQERELEDSAEEISNGLAEIETAETELNAGIQQLEQGLATAEGELAQLAEQEAGLEEQKLILETLGSSITPEQQAALDAINSSLAELAPAKAALEEQVSQLEGQLEQMNQSLEELTGQKSQLTTAQDQLTAGQAQIHTARQQLETQFNAAQDQLDTQTASFEEARDQAYEEANLDGVITAELIQSMITAQNLSMPAGYVSEGEGNYLVKLGDEIQSVEELQSLPLLDLDMEYIDQVTLGDVAEIYEIDNSDELYTKINGNDGVMLSFQKQTEYSTADVCHSINEEIAQLTQEYPGLHITVLMNQGVYIDMIIGSVLENLIYGGLLAILVLLVFLKSVKPTIVVAFSIPISLVFAIALMYFTGVTLNIISLAGLALGVGMLVDNSIVVIENIYRMRSLGTPPKRAAIEGAKQVGGAIFASTLTTVCVFLPIVFTEGITREIFADMGLTIAYSLLASLVVALTLVPSMSASLLKNTQEKKSRAFEAVKRGYGRALAWTLSHKWVTLTVALVLFVFSIYQVLGMGIIMIPEMDSDQMTVTLEMEEGSTAAETKEAADQAAQLIGEIDGVDTVGATIGGLMMTTSGNDTTATMLVLLDENREKTSSQVGQEILEKAEAVEGYTLSVQSSNMDVSALGGSGIQVQIKGSDTDQLMEIGKDVAAILGNLEGVVDISDGTEEAAQEIRITVDKEAALDKGLTVAQIYGVVQQALSEGETAAQIDTDEGAISVSLTDSRERIETADQLRELALEYEEDGETKTVPLRDVAEITYAEGLASIQRDNQQRVLTVSADVDESHNVTLVSRELEEQLEQYIAPEGYTIAIEGESETIASSMQDMLFMIAVAIVLIYLIMVAQFQSLLYPFIVLFTIPLAFTGGLLALLLCGMELSMMAALGFLVLTGVVVNNGIVFVDYANKLREQGMEKREALIETGKTRLRPILMTALTTILALVTMALGIGNGAEMLQSMAIVTIGGLTYATLLTLFIVPSLYEAFTRKKAARKEEEDDDIAERKADL